MRCYDQLQQDVDEILEISRNPEWQPAINIKTNQCEA
jgi:hypothetical protein